VLVIRSLLVDSARPVRLVSMSGGSLASSIADVPPAASLIIPAYNEERGLEALLPRLVVEPIAGLEVIIVDDGSTDGTAEVAKKHGARLITHPDNRGKGAALQTGLAAAGGPKILVMDGDDTYPTDAIPELLGLLETHDHVRGIRTIGRANIPPLNRVGNALISLAVRVVSGVRSADPLTGLYALHATDLRRMRLTSTGFGLETEIAIKSARMKLRTADHQIRYGPRQGQSKLNPLRDGIVILGTILSLLWAGMRSRSRFPETD
jgi:glycosyltransferase involved in cell wall biosynthesis